MPEYVMKNPTTGEVWRSSQRGRRPAWVLDLIAAGGKAEESGSAVAHAATPLPESTPTPPTLHPPQDTSSTQVVVHPETGEVWRAGKRGRRPDWVNAQLRGHGSSPVIPTSAAGETPAATPISVPAARPAISAKPQPQQAEATVSPATQPDVPVLPRLHDLLTDPIFRIRSGGMAQRLSLPALLVHISSSSDGFLEFSGLRPHQTHAIHAFLCQLMALVMRRLGGRLGDISEGTWRATLIDMAGSPSAWHLVVTDHTQPAFMQAPTTSITGWKVKSTPDEMDIPFTGRDWESKASSMQFAEADHWAYALITNATCNGYSGPGYQQASRMNGAYGTRTCVCLAPARGGWAAHIRRDVQVLCDVHDTVAAAHGYAPVDGIALTWPMAWDGALGSSLPLNRLDPWFIENARIVRLRIEQGRIAAHVAGSKTMRIDAKSLAGVLGDPWLPILTSAAAKDDSDEATGDAEDESGEDTTTSPSASEARTSKGLGLRETGFHLRLLLTLFTGTACQLPPTCLPHPHDPEDLHLVARGIGRGQGKTLGIHEVHIPVTPTFRHALSTPAGRVHLTSQAESMMADITHLRTKGVFPAAARLLREPNAPSDDRVQIALTAYERGSLQAIQPILAELLAGPADTTRQRWRDVLVHAAESAIAIACDRSVLGGRRYAGISAAEGLLDHATFAWRQTGTSSTSMSTGTSHV